MGRDAGFIRLCVECSMQFPSPANYGVGLGAAAAMAVGWGIKRDFVGRGCGLTFFLYGHKPEGAVRASHACAWNAAYS